MPKKLNFLGGMQNYNPNNGEYEPALKGPNGESPKSFAKFGKGDSEKKESPKTKDEEALKKEKFTDDDFDDLIDEGLDDIGKEFDKPIPEQKYFKHPQVDGLWKDTGKTFEKNGSTYKVFENEEGTKWGVSEKFASQFEEAKAPKVEKKPEDYEGIKTTPYGFIYDVNGKSITDLKEQSKKLGLGNASGYSLTLGGDESYYKTFEEAYKAAKGK